LSDSLEALLAPLNQSLCAPAFERVRAHLYSQLLCLGRHTITGLLSTQGRIHQDWSADYRLYSYGRVEPEALFGAVRQGLEAQLRPQRPLVVAIDDSILRKRGARIPGVRWSRDPLGPPFAVNFVRAQRVLQFSAALPKSATQARMVPIDFVLAPPAPPLRAKASAQERAEYQVVRKAQSINAVAAERLELLAQQTSRSIVALGDGRFANARFLRPALARSTVITRIRKDSALFFPVQEQPATGRRRIYGERAPSPEELRCNEAVGWQRVRGFACGQLHHFRVKRLQSVRSPLSGAQNCQLLVIAPLGYRLRAQGRLLYRQPAYLLCTDAQLSLQELLQYYLWRWDIEVNFRDEKTLLGVGQAQVRTEQSAARVPATAVAAYGLLLVAAAKAFPTSQDSKVELFPPPRWRTKNPPRSSTAALLDHLRFELFAHALKAQSFTGFWSTPSPNQSGPKLPVSLASALFHLRN
jgi:DDE superfamily endonuclease